MGLVQGLNCPEEGTTCGDPSGTEDADIDCNEGVLTWEDCGMFDCARLRSPLSDFLSPVKLELTQTGSRKVSIFRLFTVINESKNVTRVKT